MTTQKFAQVLSFFLGPQVWFPLLLIIFLFKTGLKTNQQLILAPLLFLFLIVIPFGFLYILVKRKKIGDWDIRNRKERFKILPVFLISTFSILILSKYLGTPLFFHLFMILWIVAFVGSVITFWWKISLHLMLNTAAVIIINFLFGWNLPILYLLIPIIGWARYYHKHHTILQIILGTLVSGMLALTALKYFGYI